MTRKVTLWGYNWDMCEYDYQKYKNLPYTTYVYMIAIRKKKSGYRRVMYVGVTNNLRGRICSHSIPRILRNILNEHKVEILYKNFGNITANAKIESALISSNNPLFNVDGTCNGKLYKNKFLNTILGTDFSKQ